jgi:hypothetical protein
LTACGKSPSTATVDPSLAPEFREFWSRGGGRSTFGPPVSAANRFGGQVRQTFLAVEMIYEETSSGGEVRLAPLGRDLGLADPAVAPIEGQSDAYDSETGHTVYTGFAGLYERLGGKEVAGGPISEVDFRDGQIVQYFENLGMVRPENASPAEARLLALGLIYRPSADSAGLDTGDADLAGRIRERPFAAFLADHGGEAVFGQPLTTPYIAGDGALEQIYERAVVFSMDGSRRGAALRPVGRDLGPAEGKAPRSDEAGALYFKKTGHNVLWAFADFYRAHDGERLMGLPLEEASLEGDVMVQRFENGVLHYRFDLPAELAVQLAPLGAAYLASHPVPTAVAPDPEPEPMSPAQTDRRELEVEANLRDPLLLPGEEQAIEIRVSRADGSPVSGVSVVLSFSAAEDVTRRTVRPTGRDGRTSANWRDEDGSPGRIVNVQISASRDGEAGSLLLQYAYAFPSDR